MSTSGVLGRFIELPPPVTICLRSLLGCVILFLFCKWRNFSFKIQKQDIKMIALGGFLLGLHWITYFQALRISSVAIGMLSLFSYPAITAILEPLFFKTKILKFHLLLGVMVLIGIYFLAPDFDLKSDNLKAVGWGMFSALCYSLRNILMKQKVSSYNGSILMGYQLLMISVCLMPVLLFLDTSQILDFVPATLALAFITTSLGHTLFLYSFKSFSAATSSIISCAQPIYGTIFGMIFLSEYPASTTIIGGVIILSTVLAESIRISKARSAS